MSIVCIIDVVDVKAPLSLPILENVMILRGPMRLPIGQPWASNDA